MSEIKWRLELFMETNLFNFDYSFNEFVLSTSHCYLGSSYVRLSSLCEWIGVGLLFL